MRQPISIRKYARFVFRLMYQARIGSKSRNAIRPNSNGSSIRYDLRRILVREQQTVVRKEWISVSGKRCSQRGLSSTRRPKERDGDVSDADRAPVENSMSSQRKQKRDDLTLVD